MKLAFAFLAVCFAFVAKKNFDGLNSADAAFEDFKRQFSKSYRDFDEASTRRRQYEKCLSLIKLHNSDYAAGRTTFSLKANKFCDFYEGELRKFATGSRKPPFAFSDYRLLRDFSVNDTASAPASFDWREMNCVTPAKDQGIHCSSAWAFSAIAALESHWCIKKRVLMTLSEQQLVDCNRNKHTGNWACDGGNAAAAFMYIQATGGVQSDTTYQYQEDIEHDRDFPCRFTKKKAKATAKGYWQLANINSTTLRSVITLKGPVVALMSGSLETFQLYSTGVFDDPSCQHDESFHSVLIIGYGSENGVVSALTWFKCWLVADGAASIWLQAAHGNAI